MIILKDILYLEFNELVDAGIPLGTVKSSLQREVWHTCFHPSDARKRLISYDSLNAIQQTVIQHKFGNPHEYAKSQMIDGYLQENPEDVKFITNYRTSDGKYLSIEHQNKYRTALKYLRLALQPELLAAVYSKDSFYQALCQLIEARDIALPSTPVTLLRKAKQYQVTGAQCLLGKHGNKSAQKFGKEQLNWCLTLYSSHLKPSLEMVHRKYNENALSNGWPIISLSTLKHKLAPGSPLRQAAELSRDPLVHKQKYLYSISTTAATKRDALWESDGTKLNLFYRDETGKVRADLQVYLVADSASRYIIGYHFSNVEDHLAVYNGYKMAVARTGVRPFQIMKDNGGAHSAKATVQFIESISHVSFNARPYNGQSKTIEKTIGMWQDQVLRYFDSFTGMNIRTKSDDSHINTEWVKQNPQAIKSKAETIQMAIDSIEVWNNKKQGKMTPKEAYYSLESAGMPIEPFDMVNLFWLQRSEPLTYRKDGITLEIGGERRIYAVYAQDGNPDHEFLIEHCLKKFIVKYDPEDLSSIHLFLEDITGLRWVAEAQIKERVMRAVADYRPGERARIQRELSVKDKQVEKLKYIIDEASAEVNYKMGFANVFKNELNDAEGDLVVASINSNNHRPNVDPMLPDDFVEGSEWLDFPDEL